ncbi:hypothetical protein [Pseudomonas abietaniphila]|uniref:Uncharacterized protein n=1 Tax=Pseudomonas abietaniphila TaxID=89065 RepID=A0A1G8NIH2_9PSED|nr:hypothetical protein [Pseudomonas abietaniphila]SDI79300.1 hypothetical protein SAMN05216605_11776 [Pseudomonas abietaniphila]
MNNQVAKGDAELMMDAGIFMSTIAGLISDDLCEQADGEGRSFLNPYRLEGLMKGLLLAAHRLEERSEWLSETVENEEKLAQAALARCQGRDDHRESNVGAECGRARAA